MVLVFTRLFWADKICFKAQSPHDHGRLTSQGGNGLLGHAMSGDEQGVRPGRGPGYRPGATTLAASPSASGLAGQDQVLNIPEAVANAAWCFTLWTSTPTQTGTRPGLLTNFRKPVTLSLAGWRLPG